MSALLSLFSRDIPTMAAQMLLLSAAVLDIFLILFTARDVLLRSDSVLLQIVMVALSTVLPVAGFLLYLLVRPSQTLKERERDQMLHTILTTLAPAQANASSAHS